MTISAFRSTAVALLFAGAASSGSLPQRQITFTKDVAPIFQAKCESCHRPGEMAPMPLITYEQVRPWAKDIRERVATRQMPPWHMDPTVGIQSFENDISLSNDQIETIVKWVADGAPKGDPKDMPPPKSGRKIRAGN